MKRLVVRIAWPVALVLVWAAHGAGAEQEGLDRWKFLIGEWRIVERRFDFDAKPIGTRGGHAAFSHAMHGQRIEELQTIAGEDTMTALQVFVYDPRSEEIEIARTDSGHYGFSIIAGAMSDNRITLKEKHPDPKSQVTRRFTYVRTDDDHFLRQLEFSTDGGSTWFVRNLQEYTRRK